MASKVSGAELNAWKAALLEWNEVPRYSSSYRLGSFVGNTVRLGNAKDIEGIVEPGSRSLLASSGSLMSVMMPTMWREEPFSVLFTALPQPLPQT
ncbi:hypothetical protein [Malonomonas rubra]|uniref:hypothetical protein n=1 Tax=Malonomonas rubra TaxID=57040 RepID=UPI0026E92026|nr:hypothetical protein [Malonomonas rubra]